MRIKMKRYVFEDSLIYMIDLFSKSKCFFIVALYRKYTFKLYYSIRVWSLQLGMPSTQKSEISLFFT